MKQNILTATLLFVLGITCTFMVVQTSASGQPERGTKWEYGQLKLFKSPESDLVTNSAAIWVSDAKWVERKTLADVYKELGGQDYKGDLGVIALWNLLGEQGWEYVSEVFDPHEPAVYRHAIFKRVR